MSTFSDKWVGCMHEHKFPVPTFEDAREALEFLDHLNQAIENTGGDAEVTIGVLLLAGAILGVDEAVGAVLAEAAGILATTYLLACVSCLGTVAIDDLRGLFASNEVPDSIAAKLSDQGFDLTATAVA